MTIALSTFASGRIYRCQLKRRTALEMQCNPAMPASTCCSEPWAFKLSQIVCSPSTALTKFCFLKKTPLISCQPTEAGEV